MEIKFWNRQEEITDRKYFDKLQLERLQKTVDLALKTTFYKRLAQVQIKFGNDIKSRIIDAYGFVIKSKLEAVSCFEVKDYDSSEVIIERMDSK